jgi:hypothetical protein
MPAKMAVWLFVPSRYNTPTEAILFSASGILLFFWTNVSQVDSVPIPCIALWPFLQKNGLTSASIKTIAEARS